MLKSMYQGVLKWVRKTRHRFNKKHPAFDGVPIETVLYGPDNNWLWYQAKGTKSGWAYLGGNNPLEQATFYYLDGLVVAKQHVGVKANLNNRSWKVTTLHKGPDFTLIKRAGTDEKYIASDKTVGDILYRAINAQALIGADAIGATSTHGIGTLIGDRGSDKIYIPRPAYALIRPKHVVPESGRQNIETKKAATLV